MTPESYLPVVSAKNKKSHPAPAAPAATAPSAPPPPAGAGPLASRRELIANLTLVLFGVYVALIYLLALDQQFHWGIFGP
jgi:hypothetical protein